MEKGTHLEAPARLPWRGRARLAAAVGNSVMVLYVYAAHLLGVEWQHFGRFRILEAGQSRSLRDYLWLWELDPAFEHLRLFTFSEAMLENLSLYLLVGTPVAVTLFTLERDRIRWLQALLTESLPKGQAGRASFWLELYLWALGIMFVFILAIGPFHLGLPRAHYFCAGCALLFGSASMGLYLAAPVDFSAVAAAGDDVAAWTSRVQRWVRPVLKLVLGLHAVALAAGVWKAESLGDDRMALIFGILETLLVLGYQLFQGVFVVDDIMVARKAMQRQELHQNRAAKPVADGAGVEDKLLGS